MPIASFADKIFEVSGDKVYTFNEMQFGNGLETEKQDNPGAKPKTYIKGPDLSTLTIKIPLNIDMGTDPRTEIGNWMALKDARTAYPFIIGGRPFGADLWLLKDVQSADFVLGGAGDILSVTATLTFEEYVYAGAAKETKKSAGKKSTGGQTPGVYQVLSPSQKKDLK